MTNISPSLSSSGDCHCCRDDDSCVDISRLLIVETSDEDLVSMAVVGDILSAVFMCCQRGRVVPASSLFISVTDSGFFLVLVLSSTAFGLSSISSPLLKIRNVLSIYRNVFVL